MVMSPGLCNRVPTTLRFGDPSESLIEKVLEPFLKENVVPLVTNSSVWKQPSSMSKSHFLISVDFQSSSLKTFEFSKQLQDTCVWCLRYEHPIRKDISRLMVMFPLLDHFSLNFFKSLPSLKPTQGEIHVSNEDAANELKQILNGEGLSFINVNATRSVGYLLHEKLVDLKPE
jgi:hypothetical protein